jgi:hypothetical protein
MATIDITDVRPNRNRFIEDRPNPPAELWAPPLAPDGTMASGHVLLGEDTIYAALGDEDPFQLPEPNNVSQTFGSRRNLIAGTSIIAVSAVAGLTYFFLFLASPGSKTPGETALQSASATSAQAALDVPAPPSPTRAQSSSETSAAVPEPSRGASSASPSPDVPVSLTANASAQVAPSAMTPSRESVFLQRPGVNIRSAPSGNAPVLGTAPRGTSFTATSREGDWVQVENPNWKGWINSQFLAPNKPL